MQTSELNDIINQIIKRKHETNNIELKSAQFGCPKRLYDTLSSFSNQDDGGIIIFGIDEDNGYLPVGVYDPQDLQKQINNQCKDMEPVVRPLITVSDFDGKSIVAAEIPGIEITQRPCYYKGKGKMKGSYTRIGDSDEPMTDYEIYSYEAYRKKYLDDIRPIEGTAIDAIDKTKLEEYKFLCKKDRPNLSRFSDKQFNEMMGITKGGKPTLMSLLLFGLYPQAFFPQLSIVATAVYGTEMGFTGENGERFSDNKRIEGTVGEMIDGAMQFVKNNMKISTTIDPLTGVRKDRPEYPITAVREVIVNALVHRDYSFHTEGMPIQLTVFGDRIEIKNPGGLYGRLRIDQLGKVQPDTRNPKLATAMEIMGLTENRYSGIPTIRAEMAQFGLPAPIFEDNRETFSVTLYKTPLAAKKSKITNDEILEFCSVPRSREEISGFLGITTTSYAISKYIKPLIKSGKIAALIENAPNSPDQRYMTVRGE